MNTLVCIGYCGGKQCYLNVDIETAVSRYCQTQEITREDFNRWISEGGANFVKQFTFDDEFWAYDAGE